MTTYINTGRESSRRVILQAIREALDLGDDVVVSSSADATATHARDWLTARVIYGNHGELVVARSGEVLWYDRTDDLDMEEGDGYADIVHVELDQWRRHLDLEWADVPQQIDILKVAFHTKDGTYEPAINA